MYTRIVLAVPHNPDKSNASIKHALIKHVIIPVLSQYHYESSA